VTGVRRNGARIGRRAARLARFARGELVVEPLTFT
jgi:hypothetical protein